MPHKRKITEAGQLCRHCDTPVVRRTGRSRVKRGRAYRYEWFFQCPKCSAFYMVEAAKRYEDRPVVENEGAPRLFQ